MGDAIRRKPVHHRDDFAIDRFRVAANVHDAGMRAMAALFLRFLGPRRHDDELACPSSNDLRQWGL